MFHIIPHRVSIYTIPHSTAARHPAKNWVVLFVPVVGYFLIPEQKNETGIGDTQKIKFARLPFGNIREVLRTHSG